MTTKKFEEQILTLKKFYEYYCQNKHSTKDLYNIKLNYNDTSFEIELNLCKECIDNISYSFERLQECPHEEKPRCRKCPTPCYEKYRWRHAAKVMKYSAINLGLSSVKQKVKNFFTS